VFLNRERGPVLEKGKPLEVDRDGFSRGFTEENEDTNGMFHIL